MKKIRSILGVMVVVVILMVAFAGEFLYKKENGTPINTEIMESISGASQNHSQAEKGSDASDANNASGKSRYEVTNGVFRLEEHEIPDEESYLYRIIIGRDIFFKMQCGKIGETVLFSENGHLMSADNTRCKCSAKVDKFETNEEGDYLIDFIITSYNDEVMVLNWNMAYTLKYLDSDLRFPEEVADTKDKDMYKYYKSGSLLNVDEVQFVKRPTIDVDEFRLKDEYADMCQLKPGENRFVMLVERPEGFCEMEGYSWCLTSIGTSGGVNYQSSFWNDDFAIILE